MKKWSLAPYEDDRLGGKLAHDIVMRHEGMHLIDHFIDDLLLDRREGSDLEPDSKIDPVL